MSRARARSGRRGFTLIELVVALSVSTVLLVAMGSLVVVTSRALPREDDRAVRALEAGRALDVMAEELGLATGVSVASAEAVVYEIEDRDGDGTDDRRGFALEGGEVVRAWSDGVTKSALIDGVGALRVTLEERDGLAVRVRVELRLKDMADEPFERTVALVNQPGVTP